MVTSTGCFQVGFAWTLDDIEELEIRRRSLYILGFLILTFLILTMILMPDAGPDHSYSMLDCTQSLSFLVHSN